MGAVPLLMTGCVMPEGGSSDGVETRGQQTVDPSIKLGEAVTSVQDDRKAPVGTQRACMKFDYNVEGIGEWEVRSFYTHKMSDVERHLDINLQGDLSGDTIDADTAWNWVYDGNTEMVKTTFSVIAQVKTVRRSTELSMEKHPQAPVNVCETSNDWGLHEFHSNCGTGYLDEELMGGYVIFTTNIEGLTEKKRHDIEGHFNLNADRGSGSLEPKMEWLSQQSNLSVSFEVHTWGISQPSSSLVSSGGTMKPADILTYIDKIREGYQNALANEEVFSEKYGNVIEQEFAQYRQADYEACGMGAQWEGLSCFSGFQNTRKAMQTEREALQRWVERIDWKLDHPNRVDWEDPVADTQDTYQQTLNDVQYCLYQAIPDRDENCKEMFANDELAGLCEACQIPEPCRMHRLKRITQDLPDAPVIPPDPEYDPALLDDYHARGKNDNTKTGPISEKICVLSEVHGGLYGGGERVSVTPANGEWKLRTETQRTKDTQDIRGEMHCTQRSLFYNSNVADEGWHQQSYSVSSDNTIGMSDGRYASSLMGVRGNMGGGGEYGVIGQKEAGKKSTLKSHAASGSLTSYGTSWGLKEIGGNTPEWSQRTDTVSTNGDNVSKPLADVEDAFCFLEKVGGEFDGTGEWARIEIRDGNWHVAVHGVCDKHKGLIGMGSKCKEWKQVTARARCYMYNQTP